MNRSPFSTVCRSLVVVAFLIASCQAQTGAPSISPGGVVSASAFGQFSSIAPGSWIEIYGQNLAATSRSWGDADFTDGNAPTSLDGTSVTIGGRSAFVDYVSPTQVNAQVPSNVAPGLQQVVVTSRNIPSNSSGLTVKLTQPGLLAPASFAAGSTQYVAGIFLDGVTFALPPGVATVASRRPRPGDILTFYGIGFGPVTPDIQAGKIVQQANTLIEPLTFYFGAAPATVTYQGLAPSAVGLYQFNVVVPSVATGDAIPLSFTLGGVQGSQKLVTSVDGLQVPQVTSLTLSTATIVGGDTLTGKVTLSSVAPAPGVSIFLSSNNSIANVPGMVTVAEGATSVQFDITTLVVGAAEDAAITATYNNSSSQAFLTVNRKPN